MTDADPISWRAIVYGTPVVSSDNAPVGDIREVLGSDSEDIFHGVLVTLAGARRDVMIGSDDLAGYSTTEVRAGIPKAEIEALPTFEDHENYHLSSVGWLRKHLGWTKDSSSGEEPG